MSDPQTREEYESTTSAQYGHRTPLPCDGADHASHCAECNVSLDGISSMTEDGTGLSYCMVHSGTTTRNVIQTMVLTAKDPNYIEDSCRIDPDFIRTFKKPTKIATIDKDVT